MPAAVIPIRFVRPTSCQSPLLDFLAPRFAHPAYLLRPRRQLSSSSVASLAAHNIQNASDPEYPPPSQPLRAPRSGVQAVPKPASLHKPLSQAQRDFLTSAVSSRF